MLKTIFTKRNLITSISTIVLFSLIAFVEKETSEKEIKDTIIKIKDEYGTHFIEEGDVLRLMTAGHTDSVRGKLADEINLKELEHRIKSNKFVKTVQVYKDFKGNILVELEQCRPLARVIQNSGPQAYIGEQGKILPVSDKFTARVLIIGGDGAGKLLDSTFRASEEGKNVLMMLEKIDTDPFLKAQISEINRYRNGELELYPQVGNELILFGKPEDVESKFKKLKIYYKKIMQVSGYNRYKTVNLKFQDQIICE
jgi:cell division protein FtsQ